jgi:hypothetical protein
MILVRKQYVDPVKGEWIPVTSWTIPDTRSSALLLDIKNHKNQLYYEKTKTVCTYDLLPAVLVRTTASIQDVTV